MSHMNFIGAAFDWSTTVKLNESNNGTKTANNILIIFAAFGKTCNFQFNATFIRKNKFACIFTASRLTATTFA